MPDIVPMAMVRGLGAVGKRAIEMMAMTALPASASSVGIAGQKMVAAAVTYLEGAVSGKLA